MSPKNMDDELIASLEKAERSRRKRTLLTGGLVALLVIAAFGLSFVFSNELFQPEIDIESGEEDILADTNDPQCRAFIAHVTRIGGDYFAAEPDIESGLLSDDPADIQKQVDELERLKAELAAAEETANAATLRFDDSRQEVNDWFAYTDNELTLLQKVGKERLIGISETQNAPDAGTVVEGGEAETSDKTPQERVDGATLAANEAFQKFRVWHTGGLHPCGQAAKGEEPWTPGDKEVK